MTRNREVHTQRFVRAAQFRHERVGEKELSVAESPDDALFLDRITGTAWSVAEIRQQCEPLNFSELKPFYQRFTRIAE